MPPPPSNQDRLRLRIAEQKALQTAINSGAYSTRAKLMAYLKNQKMTVVRDGNHDLEINSPRCGTFRVTLGEGTARKGGAE